MATTTIQSSVTDEVRRKDQFHALKKLRSEDSVGQPEASGARSLDGFAEVFAAIASSSTAPIESSRVETAAVEPVSSGPVTELSHRESVADHSAPSSNPQSDVSPSDQSPVEADHSGPGNARTEASATNSTSEVAVDAESEPTQPTDGIPDADPVARESTDEPAVDEAPDALKTPTASEETGTEDPAVVETTRRGRGDQEHGQGPAGRPVDTANAVDGGESTEAGEPVLANERSSTTDTIQAESGLVGDAGGPSRSQTSEDAPRRENRQSPEFAPEKVKDAGSAKTEVLGGSNRVTDSAALSPELTPASSVPKPTPSTTNIAQAAAAVTAATSASAGTAASSAAGAKAAGVRAASAAAPPITGLGKASNVAVDSKSASKPVPDGREDAISRVKLVQRVSRAFQGLGAEGGRVRLRLAPDELGTVQVDMKVVRNTVDAKVIAQSEAAGAALREHLPELRSRLESFGLNVERLDVEVEGDSAGFDSRQSYGFGGEEGFGDRRQTPRQNRPTTAQRDDSHASDVAASSLPVISATGGLNPAGQIDLRL